MKIIIFCLFAFLIIEGNIVNAKNACNKCSSGLKTYCDAEWVVRVLVHIEQEDPPQFRSYEYDVMILESYKFLNKTITKPERGNGMIRTDAGDCEVKLKNGTEYLIGGGFDNGDFYINKCNSIVKKWKKINEVKEGLKNGTLNCKK
ncbi:hypothetical protein ACQ4LE_008946 [Meloidogyne hapla]|uniref:NTR domain-containing protein n=1 Tax=Meloidogyne hapla TaxID=6305 RepID=A0A1I8B6K4_MELHA